MDGFRSGEKMPFLNRAGIVNVIAMITRLRNTVPYAESSSVLTSADGNVSAAMLCRCVASLATEKQSTLVS